MKVLVQYDLAGVGEGIWWVDEDGTPSSYYPEQTPGEVMAKAVLAGKTDDVGWEDFFDQLTQRSPTFTDYETTDISVSPQEFLDELRRKR